jgi:hypothetical protein
VKITRIELSNQLRSESQHRTDKGNQGKRSEKHPNEAKISPHERPHQDSRAAERNNDQQHDGPYPKGEALLFFEEERL